MFSRLGISEIGLVRIRIFMKRTLTNLPNQAKSNHSLFAGKKAVGLIRKYGNFKLALHHLRFLIWVWGAEWVISPVDTQEPREDPIFIYRHILFWAKTGLITQRSLVYEASLT